MAHWLCRAVPWDIRGREYIDTNLVSPFPRWAGTGCCSRSEEYRGVGSWTPLLHIIQDRGAEQRVWIVGGDLFVIPLKV